MDKTTNYDRMCRQAAELFLRHDPQEILARLPLRADSDWLYASLCGEDFRISRRTGDVELLPPGDAAPQPADSSAAMTLYDILCRLPADAVPTGEYVPVPELAGLHNAASYAGAGAYARLESYLDSRGRELAAVLSAMGGEPYGRGDVSFRLPMFGEWKLVLGFWHSDEDFPASLTPLVDRGTLQCMHYETIWYMMGYLLGRVRSAVEALCEG